MLKHIGFPKGMVNKLKSGTASTVATELCRRVGETTALMQGEDNLVAFAQKGRYKEVPTLAVVESLEAALGTDVDYHRAYVMPNYDVRIEVVGLSR